MPTLENINYMLSMPNLPQPHRQILMDYLDNFKYTL